MIATSSDPRLGTIRVDGCRVRIELNDPLQRDSVVERLGFYYIEPLKMLGAPAFPYEEPPHKIKLSEMTVSQFKAIIRVADAGAMALPPKPELLDYMRRRIEFEVDWAMRNPHEYRTITLTGAPTDWPDLLCKFLEHDGRSVSLELIESFQRKAVEAWKRTGA